jgi:hemolysin III
MFLLKNEEKWRHPTYDRTEEIMSSASHAFGLTLSIVGFFLLLYLGVNRGDIWLLISFVIYGLSLITLYLASTLYHGVQTPRVKRKLRVFDHIGIYLLIAGTYTPFMLAGMQNGMSELMGWGMLAVIWGMAFLGILWKIFFLGKFEILAVIGYIVMGVAGLVLLKDMLAAVPLATIIWLAIGGAIYILGVIFYAVEKIPYNHLIWHFFVMSASLAHFVAVLTLLR